MANIVKDLIEYILGISASSVLVYWVIKLLLKNFVKAGLENYKNNLKQDLETHKAGLTKATQEHRIKFESYHEEMAKVLRSLYEKMCECQDILIEITTMAQGQEWVIESDKDKEAGKVIMDLKFSIRAAKLYLNPQLIKTLEELQSSSVNILYQMKRAKMNEALNRKSYFYGQSISSLAERPINDWMEANKKVSSDFKMNLEEIASEFRHLLGGQK
jgi:hypothetical protein